MRIAGALLLAGWFGQPQVVAAAEPAAAEQTDDQARALELFGQSETLYKEGRFEEAAVLLEQAHALHPEPTLLYNLARAREGQGSLAEAADAYERYLQESPEASDRGAIEQRIRSLRAREAERVRLEQQQRETQERLAQMERERAANPPDEGGSALDGPLPWVIFGVGVAGVGVGFGVAAAAQAKHDDAVEEPVQVEAVSKQDAAEDLALGANVAIVAGAAIALSGGVLGIVGLASSGSADEPPPAAAWQLRVGPAFVGIEGCF